MSKQLAQIAQSVKHETLDPRVVGSSLQEKLQKLQMITGLSSNDSSESLECRNWSVIRDTSTPCSQLGEGTVEWNGTDRMENGEHRGHPRSLQDTSTFPETTGKFIPNFREHSPKGSPPSTPRKSMRAPKYNYAQRMRKFTGCVHSRRNLAREWIHIRVLSNGNVEPLCLSLIHI